MHRRSRHLNPRFAGASLVLDARHINQANNTALDVWPDKSGNGNNASKYSTAPTFKTGQQGGQPVVSFINQGGMTCTSGLGGSTSQITIIAALKSFSYNGNAGGGGGIISQGANNVFTQDFLVARTSTIFFFEFDSGTNGSGSLNAPGAGNQIQTILYNGAGATDAERLRFAFNGTSQTLTYNYTVPASINPSGGYHIAQYAAAATSAAWYLTGDMCSLFLIKEAINESLRKRLEQSQAFSFKLACA